MTETIKDNFVLFDLETTGLSTDTDAVIEISALKVMGGKIVEEFSTLVNPKRHIPEIATGVNGITDDMVKDAPSIEKVIKDFVMFIGDMPLVGHNIIRFDMKFINRDCARYLKKNLTNKTVDTLFVSKLKLPNIGSHSLGALADYYEVSYEGAHRALTDCRINLEVYRCLLKEKGGNNASSASAGVCPKCGNIMVKRKGKFGEFFGCMSYPDCKYTKDC